MSKKTTIENRLVDEIKQDIIEGKMLPGERIDINKLCVDYGASATPVRLALNTLVSDGLIVNKPRQGMYVREMDISEIKDIFELRRMFDLFYADRMIIAINGNPELKEELKNNVKLHMDLCVSYDDIITIQEFIKIYQLDMEFHELLLMSSGNPKLLDVFRYINPFMYTFYIYNRQTKKRNIAGVKEHEQLLECIFNEDIEELKEVINHHYDNLDETITLALKVNRIGLKDRMFNSNDIEINLK